MEVGVMDRSPGHQLGNLVGSPEGGAVNTF